MQVAPPAQPAHAAPDPRAAPLVARLVAQCGASWLNLASHDEFAAGAGDRVLFFSGDAVRFPESLDVAVVLPELQAALRRPDGSLPFRIGVVCRDDEDALARRWASQRWPALVFLRDGAYVGNLPGMHDWVEYVARVRDLLAAPAGRVPGIGIAVVSASAGADGCH
jgi:hydrogenase-1 operon protein HyaE